MSDLEKIHGLLARAGRRRRIQRALNGLAEGALLGGLLLALTLIAFKLAPIPPLSIPIAGAIAGLCALLGMARGGWKRESLIGTARWVDEQQKLKERLTTALEVSDQKVPMEWQSLVVADASQHASQVDSKKLGSISFPRRARWALVVLALAAGLGFVPEYRSKEYRQQQQDSVVVQDVGRNLAELTRHELAQRPPAAPAVQKSMEELTQLGEKLGQQTLTRADALKELTSATEKLAHQEERLTQEPAIKRLEQAARQPGNAASATPESIQKQLDSLQKALGAAADKADQLDKLARDMEKLQQQASNMAGKDGQAAEAARQQLAQNMAELGRQAQAAGASLDGLEDAIKALQSNHIDQVLRDLDLASHDLEKLQEMAKATQQLKDQQSKMGKDLAEQLKMGQAQAAIKTLESMKDGLKSAALSPEKLQKMLDELKNAGQPAQDYGKVAEFLKNALNQGKAGDKAGASQSLASAQEELKRLMDQMEDSKELEAALAALNRAQQALANRQLWSATPGQCKNCNGQGCSQCRGFGRGGRPGHGVGTWGQEDESGWTYYDAPQHGGWDNSDIKRPDMDGRGVTERSTDLNPGLVPDKVKGQMSPGNSMPSITLKGVSIKGNSNVKFEEAATAAQKDAQSALSQERVPRAYQDAVRDYFDDLKK